MRAFLSGLSFLGLSSVASAQVLVAGDFQTSARDSAFLSQVSTLDFELSGYKYEYKDTGTSLGFKIEKGSQKIGKWMPWNEAADPESQRVSYSLGRFLHMSDLVAPTTYYTIRGRALRAFERMVWNADETEKWRAINKQHILEQLAKNPSSMFGVLVAPIKNNAEAEGIADDARNQINPNHPIAQFIRADGAMPSASVNMSLKGIRRSDGSSPVNSQLELAREFSKIMVLDCLMGQWDRWSGGNVEATYDATGVLHFIARDNGGAGMTGMQSAKKYLSVVSRFDRAQVLRLQRLQQVLRQDAAEVAKALGLLSDVSALKARVDMLLLHIEQQSQNYGRAVFF